MSLGNNRELKAIAATLEAIRALLKKLVEAQLAEPRCTHPKPCSRCGVE